MKGRQCIDTMSRKAPLEAGLYTCHKLPLNTQLLIIKENGTLILDIDKCASIGSNYEGQVLFKDCSDGGPSDPWEFDPVRENIVHMPSGKCLSVDCRKGI